MYFTSIPGNSSYPLFSDNNYVVLGGQHISAALRAVYDQYTESKGYEDDDVPNVFRAVEAEILRKDIPTELACLAAGLRQQVQNATRETNTLDVVQMMSKEMLRRMERGERPQLNEEELYLLLNQLSIPSEKKMKAKAAKPKAKDKGKTQAESLAAEMVCF